MKLKEIKPGMKVRTLKLKSTRGINVKIAHLEMRRKGRIGVIGGPVGGHNNRVWWVTYPSGEILAYRPSELEKIES